MSNHAGDNWLAVRLGWIPRPVRCVIVGVIGGTLLLLGLLGILLPLIPGFIFVPLALAILALEFAWAARWLHRIKHSASAVQMRLRNSINGIARRKQSQQPG